MLLSKYNDQSSSHDGSPSSASNKPSSGNHNASKKSRVRSNTSSAVHSSKSKWDKVVHCGDPKTCKNKGKPKRKANHKIFGTQDACTGPYIDCCLREDCINFKEGK